MRKTEVYQHQSVEMARTQITLMLQTEDVNAN